MFEWLARYALAVSGASLLVGVRLLLHLRAAERLARSGTWNIERDTAARRARVARWGLVLVSLVLTITLVATLTER